MRQLSFELTLGSRIEAHGDDWLVVGLDGPRIHLRPVNGAEGRLCCFLLGDVVNAPDYRMVDIDYAAGPVVMEFGLLDDLPADVRDLVIEREAHLLEAITGFQSGDPNFPKKGEPRSQYDPKKVKTLTKRIQNKAEEMRIDERHLWRLYRAYRKAGRDGLRPKERAKRGRDVDPRVVEGIETLRGRRVNATTIGKANFMRQVKLLLDEEHGEDVVPFPTERTFLRLLEDTEQGRHTFASARRRRTDAGKPAAPHGDFVPVQRPGQCLVFDSSPLDILGVDPVSGEEITVDLFLCLDLFSRRVPAFRVTTKNPKALDAALLLADGVYGMPEQPNWPDLYPRLGGIPDHFVLDRDTITADEREARAVVRQNPPDQVVTDHARIYGGPVFHRALKHFKTSLHLARLKRGVDKPHVERMFRTIREGFVQYLLHGYKGPTVEYRGKYLEAEAFYFPREIEERLAWWLTNYWHVRDHEGLDMPGVPELSGRTPNEMYDVGLAVAGKIWLPPARDLYFELLPIEWRVFDDSGVEIRGLVYDCADEGVRRLRRKKSSHDDHKGKWPFRCDPRDLSRIWFRHPRTHVWHLFRRRGSRYPELPFTDIMLTQAKAICVARRMNPSDPAHLSRVLDELVKLVHLDTVKGKDRRLAKNARHDMAEAMRDVAKSKGADFLRQLADEDDEFEEAEAAVDDPLAVDVQPTRPTDHDDEPTALDFLDRYDEAA